MRRHRTSLVEAADTGATTLPCARGVVEIVEVFLYIYFLLVFLFMLRLLTLMVLMRMFTT